MTKTTRFRGRKFLSQAAATAALTIVASPRARARFRAPSDMLNIAGIGVGAMGRANLINSLRKISSPFAMSTGATRENPSTALDSDMRNCAPASRPRQRSPHPSSAAHLIARRLRRNLRT